MPLKVVPPKEGRSSFYRVRGTHRDVTVDRTTGIAAGEKRAAARAQAFCDAWTLQIERGELDGKKPLTWAGAAASFVKAGGEDRFIDPISKHFGPRLLAKDIDQAMVDEAAEKIYPQGAPSTRNRQVYAPISAVLRHNGLGFDMRRPKGAQGQRRSIWLRHDEAERVIDRAAEIDVQLGTLMLLGLYTGLRLGEMLGITWKNVDFAEQTVTIERTKNGDARVAYLPPRVLTGLSAIIGAGDARVFRFTRNGRLNDMAHTAYKRAAVDCGDAPFHVLRHTWATWMVRIGADLVATKAWRSQTSARGYTHFIVSDEARKADALPGAGAKEVELLPV